MKALHNLKPTHSHTLATEKGRRTMRTTRAVLGLLLLLSVFIASGCTVAVADGTVDGPVSTSEPAPVNVPDPAAARDAALNYLAETYGDRAPDLSLSWVEANVTVEGLVGGSAFQYTADGWVVKVTFPVVNPVETVYHVVVSNEAAGFEWEGDVDANGVVVEVTNPEATWYNPMAARDAVLAHLAGNYGDRAPALGLTWTEMDATPGAPDKPLPGATSLRYVAADWVMTLSYPVVRPDLVVYRVTLENAALGFKWEGKVDAAGQVTEGSVSTGGRPAVAWFGRVVSLPAGSQFDDYLSLMPEGTGEIGVEGANEAIEAQIVALRDRETSQFANFWGTLRCDVIDYGGCQLLVTRVRSGMEMTDPEPVEGWEGTIVELFYDEPGAPHPDDAFILVGDYPVRYGIASYIAENGLPVYKQELEKWRDTGQTLRVWGQLICGFPDANACQLRVNRIEIVGCPPAPVPTATPTPVPVPTATPVQSWTESIEDWWGEIVSNPPGAQWDDYFERQIVNGGQYGIESLDPTIQAQLIALRDTGTTVHIWGTLHHHVPDYNAAQIQVTRIEVPEPPKPPETTEEPVDGWVGTIGKFPWDAQFGIFFEREDGQRFGIQALGASAAVKQQIETYQWRGARVQVWGRLVTGIPDVNGRRVEVERIESISGPEEGDRNLALFATASASSVLPSDRWGTYHAWSAIDGRLDSPWTEGVAGPGIDEWVMLTFPGTVEVWGIGLDVGYDRDADLFRANNRIKRALLVFSNGEQVEVNLADKQGMQMTSLARAPGPSIETTYVKVVIKEIYPGTRYDDTCLGEIEVLGRTK